MKGEHGPKHSSPLGMEIPVPWGRVTAEFSALNLPVYPRELQASGCPWIQAGFVG